MRWSTAQPWISLTHKKKERCIACHWTALTLMTLATVTVYIPTIIYFLIQAALRRPFIIVLLAIYHLKYKKHKANKEMLPVCCKIRDCFLRHGLDICSCLRCKKNPTTTIIKNFFFSQYLHPASVHPTLHLLKTLRPHDQHSFFPADCASTFIVKVAVLHHLELLVKCSYGSSMSSSSVYGCVRLWCAVEGWKVRKPINRWDKSRF